MQDEATNRVIGDSSYNELVSRLIATTGSDAPPPAGGPPLRGASFAGLAATAQAPFPTASSATAPAKAGISGADGTLAEHSSGGVAMRIPSDDAEVHIPVIPTTDPGSRGLTRPVRTVFQPTGRHLIRVDPELRSAALF